MSHKIRIGSARRRRAVAIIYIVVAMAVMLGFCSLAVDLGRVQVAKTELRRAADAAARAACANLSNGSSQTKNAAVVMAALNNCDGTPIQIDKNLDITFLQWNGPNNYTVVGTAAQANAVRVHCHRTAADGNPIPLMFASILGPKSCDVNATATAALNATSATQFISAFSNPWLAGEPQGTLASIPDPNYKSAEHPWKYDIAGPPGGFAASGEPYESPVQVALSVTPGSTITITNVTGLINNDFTRAPTYDATGHSGVTQYIYNDDASNGVGEHGISDLWTPIDSMIGVFLTDKVPDNNPTPPVLDFSTQSARDYAALSPKVQQTFYAGDGQTSSGNQQSFVVPSGATRLFLGTMDGHEWSNNIGGFTATITQTNIVIVQ